MHLRACPPARRHGEKHVKLATTSAGSPWLQGSREAPPPAEVATNAREASFRRSWVCFLAIARERYVYTITAQTILNVYELRPVLGARTLALLPHPHVRPVAHA